MAITHKPLYLDHRSFVQWKIVGMRTSCIWIIIFCNGPLEYDDGGIFKLLMWTQDLHHSNWNHKIVYDNRSLKDEQLLISPILK
jgi:hypothetical protein